jgi:hypothetical protein
MLLSAPIRSPALSDIRIVVQQPIKLKSACEVLAASPVSSCFAFASPAQAGKQNALNSNRLDFPSNAFLFTPARPQSGLQQRACGVSSRVQEC